MARIVRNDALYKQVTAAIRDDITQGVYGPGEALPSETRMLEQYGVSRTTLRQALVILRTEGLIEIQHGKGSFVRSRSTTAAALNRPRTEPLHTIGEARIFRQDADATTAALTGIPEGSAMYVCETTATDPTAATPPTDPAGPAADASGGAETPAEAPPTTPARSASRAV